MSLDKDVSKGQRVRHTETLHRQEIDALKRLALIVLLGLATLTVGCGTLVGRGKSSKTYSSSGYYYVGVQYDWRLLTLESRGSYDYVPEFCYLSVVCPFATLLSMPVDFVVDTVMLYSDHQNRLVEERHFNGYLRDTYCLPEGGPDEAALRRLGLGVDFCLEPSK
ncbi:YceK/YidQ family lipoprotein [Pseudomonas sp. 37 R 15]|uniref:YceK/YidQ family lipoprotein n=1 Tax=Pseudomonas sp. 37 R 15 TaxID=1844104 RepID=UPI002113F301|nr:YceK/YidQ family lipoprotein [Pseudomonas sp. 37 R 15]